MIWWIEQYWMIFVYWEWWISIEATKICYFGLPLSGIGSKPIRLSDVLNLKNLKTIWGIKLIFASTEGTKNVILFWIMLDNTLGQSVYRIFYFWLVWLFNLNIGDPLLRCNYFLACLKISRKVFKHFWRISIACATVPPQLYFFKVLYHDPVQ